VGAHGVSRSEGPCCAERSFVEQHPTVILDGICRRSLIELNLGRIRRIRCSKKFVAVAGCHAVADSDRKKCDVEIQIDKSIREHNEGQGQTERRKE